MRELYLGIMSGTSLDGVDIALCSIDAKHCELLAFREYPFGLKNEILSILSSKITLEKIGALDVKLGKLFASLIQRFLKEECISPLSITAIGLHGQTLWHAPDIQNPFSMQLGSAHIVVAKTGIKTVTDFRNSDIVHGGQGAPFAPAFHQFLFLKEQKNIAIVNIGGMANITLLKPELKGWDSGCGNILLDLHIYKTEEKAYDAEGSFAQRGALSTELLRSMLSDAYFKKIPPKSTGRDYFNEAWLTQHLVKFPKLTKEDIQRTLLELTAKTICNDIKAYKLTELIICGGGAKNTFLMQRIREISTLQVKKAQDSDALEAMAFAWFAYKRIHHEKVDLRAVTGASTISILGALYE